MFPPLLHLQVFYRAGQSVLLSRFNDSFAVELRVFGLVWYRIRTGFILFFCAFRNRNSQKFVFFGEIHYGESGGKKHTSP